MMFFLVNRLLIEFFFKFIFFLFYWIGCREFWILSLVVFDLLRDFGSGFSFFSYLIGYY